MSEQQKPVYIVVYAMTYEVLAAKDRSELEQLLRQVEAEARMAVRVYNWLEGILRLKAGGGEPA